MEITHLKHSVQDTIFFIINIHQYHKQKYNIFAVRVSLGYIEIIIWGIIIVVC